VNTTIIQNRIGRQYKVIEGDTFYSGRFGTVNGPYQVRNLRYLRSIQPNARTIIDVGMNIGSNTIEYSTWAERVIGFEPHPVTFSLAKDTIAINQPLKLKGKYYPVHNPDKPDGWHKIGKNQFSSLDMKAKIKTYNYGLGNAEGELYFTDKINNAGQNHISNTETPLSVKVKTLDSFNFADVDIIKIDVEGYEKFVIEGALNTISTCQPIIQMEMTSPQCRKFGYTPQDLYELMFTLGDYKVTDYDGNDLGKVWKKLPGVIDHFFVPIDYAT
jgi:FkbM family methyltransferase